MNVRRIKQWHERRAVELSRSEKSVAARAHALRALQLEKIIQVRREVRGQRLSEDQSSAPLVIGD